MSLAIPRRSRVGLGAAGAYGMHAGLLAFAVALLALDGQGAGRGVQVGLGAITLGVLAVCLVRLPPGDRWAVWLCVPVSALWEVLGSLVWGGYSYRLHNIPAYVPPGHALVFLFGLTAASLPLVARRERDVVRVVLAVSGAWALAGLTLSPLAGGRIDVQGAAMWPLLAWCLLRSGRGTLFAAIWVATATLEIAGTAAGAWTWAAVAPWSHLPSGNPPSAVAAGYAIIDGSVALLAASLARLGRRRPSSGRARAGACRG